MNIKLNSLSEASKFASICGTYEEDIDIIVGRYVIDAKSYLGILSTGLTKEMKIVFHGCLNRQNMFYSKIKQWEVEQ